MIGVAFALDFMYYELAHLSCFIGGFLDHFVEHMVWVLFI